MVWFFYWHNPFYKTNIPSCNEAYYAVVYMFTIFREPVIAVYRNFQAYGAWFDNPLLQSWPLLRITVKSINPESPPKFPKEDQEMVLRERTTSRHVKQIPFWNSLPHLSRTPHIANGSRLKQIWHWPLKKCPRSWEDNLTHQKVYQREDKTYPECYLC